MESRISFSDCHIHTGYSTDAVGSVEEYVQFALARGLRKICFTTHVDLPKPRRAIDWFWRYNGRFYVPNQELIKHYIDDVNDVRRKYENDIEILVGFEFSYEPNAENEIREFIKTYKPEFSIGSIHSVDSLEITSSEQFMVVPRVMVAESFLARYYSIVVSLAQSELFDVIGHIDGYVKYLSSVWGYETLARKSVPYVEWAMSKVAETGVGLEVNTAGWRKGFPDPYIFVSTIKSAKKQGVPIVCCGSDAHKPDYVGFAVDRVALWIERI